MQATVKLIGWELHEPFMKFVKQSPAGVSARNRFTDFRIIRRPSLADYLDGRGFKYEVLVVIDGKAVLVTAVLEDINPNESEFSFHVHEITFIGDAAATKKVKKIFQDFSRNGVIS